jgi:hypothetical protein
LQGAGKNSAIEKIVFISLIFFGLVDFTPSSPLKLGVFHSGQAREKKPRIQSRQSNVRAEAGF